MVAARGIKFHKHISFREKKYQKNQLYCHSVLMDLCITFQSRRNHRGTLVRLKKTPQPTTTLSKGCPYPASLISLPKAAAKCLSKSIVTCHWPPVVEYYIYQTIDLVNIIFVNLRSGFSLLCVICDYMCQVLLENCAEYFTCTLHLLANI